MKKKHLTFDVQLVNEDEEEGEKITVEAHSLRMVPIRDKRHLQFSCIDEDVPAGIDPDDWVECEYDRLPDGISWQYHEVGEWKDYPLGLAGRIESLYDGNSPHYLYTPGNPHTSGRYVSSAARGEEIGDPRNAFLHDTSTNQIIFELSNRGTWERDCHNVTDNMTERNFFTGMQRRVRRLGGTPRPGGDDAYRKRQNSFVFEPGIVDWNDTRDKCGLCGKMDGPFLTTECCGRLVCDTEGQYRINSYEREGQCSRNHRMHSICAHHNSNNHEGDWKSCTKCEEDYHPYDYAVKATSQAASGTVRRYNFDDNVRTDINPADLALPNCNKCGKVVDTTEASEQTFNMRKVMSGGTITCGLGCMKRALILVVPEPK